MRKAFLLGVLAVTGCSSVGKEDPILSLYERLELLRAQYNHAMLKADTRIQDQIMVALTELSNRYFERLAQDLKQGPLERKILAAFALGFSRKRSALQPLMAALNDGAKDVRQNVLGSLGVLQDEQTPIDPLRNAIADSERDVRVAALFALSRVLPDGDDRGLLPLLHKALSDPVPEVRNEALVVLRRVHKPDSVDPIIARGVKSETGMIRANSVVALGMIAYTQPKEAKVVRDRILEHLVEALRDSQHIVVQAAHQSLKYITGKEFDRQYQTWREWYDEEKREEARAAELKRYVCPDHPDMTSPISDKCRVCFKEMIPASHTYLCPDHADVVGASEGNCPKCGKKLVLRRQEK